MMCENVFAQSLREQDAVSADKVTGLGKAPMRRDKALPREAIAVEEDQIAPSTRRDRPIADLGEAESAIFLPHVLERDAELGQPGADHVAGLRSRSVIRHHDFEIPVGLARERA